MQFFIIFGPGAVGKMTVGKALAEKTGLKLFHNHVSLEFAFQYFEFGTPQFRKISELIRFETFKAVASSDLPGLIFTFVWAFDLPEEEKYVDRIVAIFEAVGADIYYVELEADQAIRIERNRSTARLEAKPSKRDIKRSENVLCHQDEKYRLNTFPGEFTRVNYLKINNDHLTAEAVADQIIDHFSLPIES
ncbi:MAG: AAA family ATPase [Bacteroidota bacterium]